MGRGFAGFGDNVGLGEDHHLERQREIRTQRSLHIMLKSLGFLCKLEGNCGDRPCGNCTGGETLEEGEWIKVSE